MTAEKTKEERLKITGLSRPIGIRQKASGVGFYKYIPRSEHCFLLPQAKEINDYMPIGINIIEQDVRALALEKIDFSLMKTVPMVVEDRNVLSLFELPYIRLGLREIAVLLTDYTERGGVSYLEQLRLQGVTKLVFPGTVFFSYRRTNWDEQYQVYSMPTAYYCDNPKRFPFEKGWHIGEVTFFLHDFHNWKVKESGVKDLTFACLDPRPNGSSELGIEYLY